MADPERDRRERLHDDNVRNFLSELVRKEREGNLIEDESPSTKEEKWQTVGGKKRQKKLEKEYSTAVKKEDRTHVVVIRIRDFDVKRVTRDQLLTGIVKAAGVPLTIAHMEDSIRINAKSNTVSVLTNDQERAQRYAEVRSFHVQDKRVDVYGHGTTPDRFRRIVVPKLLNPETEVDEGELLEHLVKCNPHTVIVDAKRMGRTPSVLITLGTHKPPGFIKFLCGLFRFHDYLEKRQACMRCWKMGHRMDTCPAPDIGRCPNCGEIHDHPPKVRGVRTEYTCTPRCLICGGQHYTGCRDCKERFKPYQEPKNLPKKAPLKKEDFVELSPPKEDEQKNEQGRSYLQALRTKKQAPLQEKRDDNRAMAEIAALKKAMKEERAAFEKQLREERAAFERQQKEERAAFQKEINDLKQRLQNDGGNNGRRQDPRRAALPTPPLTSQHYGQMEQDEEHETTQTRKVLRRRRQRSDSEGTEASVTDVESVKVRRLCNHADIDAKFEAIAKTMHEMQEMLVSTTKTLQAFMQASEERFRRIEEYIGPAGHERSGQANAYKHDGGQ